MDNGYFEFSGNILEPEGRKAFEIVMAIKREWDLANQDRLLQSPFRLRLNADDQTLRSLYD